MHTPRIKSIWTLLIGLGTTIATLISVPTTVAAQAEAIPTEPETSSELDSPDELGNGTCSPAEVYPGQVVTCRFPLQGAAETESEFLVNSAVLIGTGGFQTSSRCFIEAQELVCPNLPSGYEKGTSKVSVTPLSFNEEIKATFEVLDYDDGIVSISVPSPRIYSVFAGTPSAIDLVRSPDLPDTARTDLLLRRKGSDEILNRFTGHRTTDFLASVDVLLPEPGFYTIAGCVLDQLDNCEREGARYPIAAVATEPVELFDGHNGPPGDRINLVFVGSGYEDVDAMTARARDLLSFDGDPLMVSYDDDYFELWWGPFAIEPLRTNLHRFNFWYLNDQIVDEGILFDPGGPLFTRLEPDHLGLGQGAVLISLSNNPPRVGERAQATLPAFVDDAQIGPSTSRILGSIFLPDSLDAAPVLAHEMGHAIFGLRDEYLQYENLEPAVGYPNCAADEAQATEYWGDLIGDLDPMFNRWKEVTEQSGREFFDTEENFRVKAGVVGGCFGDDSSAIRPTQDSLMNGNTPIFGSVNRRRVEQVLDLWPEPVPVTTTTSPPPTTGPSTKPQSTTLEAEAAADLAQEPDSGSRTPVLVYVGVGLALVGGAASLLIARRRPRAA